MTSHLHITCTLSTDKKILLK